MSRRLVAFLAALLLTALPVAKVVCEARCASDAGPMGSAHVCCHGTQSSDAPSIGTLAQVCDHPADAPSNSQSQDLSSAPAIATNVVAVIGFEHAAHRAASRVVPPLSNSLSRTTQLRI